MYLVFFVHLLVLQIDNLLPQTLHYPLFHDVVISKLIVVGYDVRDGEHGCSFQEILLSLSVIIRLSEVSSRVQKVLVGRGVVVLSVTGLISVVLYRVVETYFIIMGGKSFNVLSSFL